MAATKYYRDENARHSVAHVTPIRPEQLRELVSYLSILRQLFVPSVKVSTRAKSRSFYSYGKQLIVMAPSMLNVLDLAHEWAHHARRSEWRKERQRLLNAKLPIPKCRHHDTRHRELVDWAVAQLMQRFFSDHPIAPAPAPAPQVRSRPQVVFGTLPLMLACARCGKSLPNEQFDVRVLKADHAGNTIKFERQSLCRSCR